MAVLVLAVAYLLGSIPFSYVIGRRCGIDVRRVGSGNVGASNVLRSAGVGAGVMALALDLLKGALAVGIASWLEPRGAVPALAAATAVVGHVLPVWLRFHGGKGVAVGAGAFLALTPVPLLGALLVFVVLVALTRFVSVGSIAAATALPVLEMLSGEPSHVVIISLAAALLIVFRHRSNMARLWHGTENRFGTRRQPPGERSD